MKQIKHLSSTTEDIFFFLFPIFVFLFFPPSKQICFIKNQVYSHRTGLKSPGNVITVRFLPQDEDWWLTLRSGRKKSEEGRDL